MSDITKAIASKITATKTAHSNPIMIMVVCGDMFSRKIDATFDIDEDFCAIDMGPGANKLDLVFTNVPHLVIENWKTPQLKNKHGGVSDHLCMSALLSVPKEVDFSWVRKTSPKDSDSADYRFAADLREVYWGTMGGTP